MPKRKTSTKNRTSRKRTSSSKSKPSRRKSLRGRVYTVKIGKTPKRIVIYKRRSSGYVANVTKPKRKT